METERSLLDITYYIRLLWRWLWLIVLSMLLAGASAFIVSRLTIPTYEASATLLIDQAPANSMSPDYNSLLASERLARTYAETIRKRPVLEAAIANLRLSITPEQLTKNVRVTVVRDTQLLVLTVSDSDPQNAAAIANEIVKVFSAQNRDLQASKYTASREIRQQELA